MFCSAVGVVSRLNAGGGTFFHSNDGPSAVRKVMWNFP